MDWVRIGNGIDENSFGIVWRVQHEKSTRQKILPPERFLQHNIDSYVVQTVLPITNIPLSGGIALGQKHKETLEGLDKFIECAINDDDELEKEIEGSLEYTESIVLCKSRVNRYLGNLNKLQELSTLNLSNVTTEPERKLKTNTKLQRKSLDKFSGDICGFQEFWPQYEAAIHENQNLQYIEKFNYLKSLLTDSAATAISGLPLTLESYRKAVEILKDRFVKHTSAPTLNALTEVNCAFCNGKHKANSCDLNLEERKNSLRKQSKCFRCYKKFHIKSRSKAIHLKCSICKSKGHQNSLCSQTNSDNSTKEEKIVLSS
ncbi:uncharacterized protein CEXT_777011 [Caerostris extrusa]|uniref:Peptidase aspartic putative domain-containing protein n=1 Tax=Caerostris extrusa TaxID=172846 RepID=A0AAV4N599_CAEEX|nr:uncharacterized protein CEXT_777011 [Caerostris extrusa]